MAIFIYNQKPFVRRRLRRYHLRHKIHAIKTRPNNTLRFLQRKNSIRRYLVNDLTCAARKTTFRTRKRFHNKQYTPKSKDQPFESDRTHFDIGFNKSNVAMHSDHNFSSSPNHNRSIKNNQPEQSIKSNNQKKQSPQPLNQKHSQNKPSKQTRQTISSINRKINRKQQQTTHKIYQSIIHSKQNITNTTTHRHTPRFLILK